MDFSSVRSALGKIPVVSPVGVRMLVRAPAWARVPACGCRQGAGRPVGPNVRGLASGMDGPFGGLD